MNINEITIGQASESPNNGMVGKYVLVRCRDAGVHAGVLESHAGRECVLTESRRVWSWEPTRGKTLSAVALSGVTKNSKVAAALPRIHLTENCEIMQCSDAAEQSIRQIEEAA